MVKKAQGGRRTLSNQLANAEHSEVDRIEVLLATGSILNSRATFSVLKIQVSSILNHLIL